MDKKITLTNSFHSTEINIIPKKIETNLYGESLIYVSRNQIKKIERKLCGCNCLCRKVDGASVDKFLRLITIG